MNYTAISIASLLSITIHSAVFLVLKLNYQSGLPSSAIYRPMVGRTIISGSTQKISVGSASAAKYTSHLLDSVKADNFFPASNLNESFQESQYVNIESDSKVNGQIHTDLSAKPKTGWTLNTESVSAEQVVILVLELTINKTGELDDYFVIESTAGKEQTQDILKDFRLTSFVPSFKDGKPVSDTIIVEIKIDNLDSFLDQKTEQR